MEACGKNKEIEDLRKQEASRQERIIKAKEDLAASELELQNLPIYEPPKDELVLSAFQHSIFHSLFVSLHSILETD